jgi:hypothetical protein
MGGAIYAVGGLDDGTCYDTVERYDHACDKWTFISSMNVRRGGVGVTALNVKWLIYTKHQVGQCLWTYWFFFVHFLLLLGVIVAVIIW